MEQKMDTVFYTIKMEVDMKVNLEMINVKEKEFYIIKMGKNI